MDTRDNYHADVSRISKSGLDLINRSPYHYWAKYISPDRPPEAPKKAFVVGSITNDVLLQAHLLDAQYAIVPADAPRRPTAAQINAKKPSDETLAAIDWWANFNGKIGGRTVVEADDYDRACRMRDAIHAHPAARVLLRDGVAEKTLYFEEPETGAKCKCRPDWIGRLSDGQHVLVDLKTTSDGSPDSFGRSALSWRYHVQAAFYSDGFYDATGNYPQAFIFLCVEKEYPFAVSAYYADERTIELGHKAYMKNLQTYLDCFQSGVWPGYSEKIERLALPEYIFKQL
ncbi:MAG: PD-(D/E)XK nuclease-like domain-containing protein [Saprospiraceae bacterium]